MKLRDALMALYERDGVITAHSFVQEARDGEGAVAQRLRDALPWDADDALEKYQLVVAQKHIRTFMVVYKPTPKSSLRHTRAFVSVPSPAGRGYHPTSVVAADPLMARLMLQEAERGWRDLKARYGRLSGFVEMIHRDLEDEGREAA